MTLSPELLAMIKDVTPATDAEIERHLTWTKPHFRFSGEEFILSLIARTVSERKVKSEAAIAGWNACRKSFYAVCEDVISENEKYRDGDHERAHDFGRGGIAAAKSMSRWFNSMEAEDDDNFRAAKSTLEPKS